jgi:hypothetical protein
VASGAAALLSTLGVFADRIVVAPPRRNGLGASMPLTLSRGRYRRDGASGAGCSTRLCDRKRSNTS